MSNVTSLFKSQKSTKVIVIEGVDGVGKATQTALLCKALEDKGFSVADFSFPMYDLPWGKVIKSMLSNEPCVTPYNTFMHPDYFSSNPYVKSMLYLNNFAEGYKTAGIDGAKYGQYKKDFIVFDRYVSSMIAFAYATCVNRNKDTPTSNNQLDWKKVMEFINFNFCGVEIDLQINLIADSHATKKNLNTRYQGKNVVDLHEQDNDLMYIVSELYRLNYNFAFDPIDAISTPNSKQKPKPFFSAIYNDNSFIDVINCMGENKNIRSKEDISNDVMQAVAKHFQLK